jgi:hypothetical protein
MLLRHRGRPGRRDAARRVVAMMVWPMLAAAGLVLLFVILILKEIHDLDD